MSRPVWLYLKVKSPSAVAAIALLPAMAIYFLYHPLVELAMRGRTPGKRMAGVRIVNRLGGTPSTLALLIRNGFRLIDSLPLFYGVGLLTTFFTAQRVRLGDLAAGTLLVHDGDSEVKALAQLGSLSLNSTLDAGTMALGNDLLLRWGDLQPARRRRWPAICCGESPPPRDPGAPRRDLDALHDRDLRQRLSRALSGRSGMTQGARTPSWLAQRSAVWSRLGRFASDLATRPAVAPGCAQGAGGLPRPGA